MNDWRNMEGWISIAHLNGNTVVYNAVTGIGFNVGCEIFI